MNANQHLGEARSSGARKVRRGRTTPREEFMAGLGELERLTADETADLNYRVERFRTACRTEGSPQLESFLPPKGERHRQLVLIQVAIADMDHRAKQDLPFRVEKYLKDFPAELSLDTIPVAVLAREYILRHRFADRPNLEEYRSRFPTQFNALKEYLSRFPPAQMTSGPAEHTPVTPVPVAPPPTPKAPKIHDGNGPPVTIPDSQIAVPLSLPPPPPPSRVGDLIGTGPVNVNDIPSRGEGSTILPTGAPYQLVRKLGSGAFGEVYEALAPGGVRVAVKRILRTVDHPASRSERESLEAIKELSHPFLLKTNAYWVFDDRLVIVMELADGSLADRIEHHNSQGRQGMPPEELIPLFEQASEALDYLHTQNVSHRDIKPENILILKGYAKVGDFGLARIHEHTLTVVQSTVGTPAYMAPEMWKQKVSLQSDQYSLAATYIRARLGRHLYTTNVLVDLANFHINEMPNLDPLPKAEQQVLLKALAKNPEDRYRSCHDFAQALRTAVMPPPEPPKQEQPTSPGTGGALWRTLAIAITCALAVGAVNWFTQNRGTQTTEKEQDDKNGQVIPPPPPKTKPWCPPGWDPVSETDIEPISDYSRTEYYRKLTRNVDGERIVAILVPPKRHTDPRAFYMLENKITNHTFDFIWSEGLKNSNSEIFKLDLNKDRAPGRWRSGLNGKLPGLGGVNAGLPVLGVTVPEAMVVAEQLGGFIPTHLQWLKAVGANGGDGPSPGPAGPALQPGDKFKQLEGRNLALGKAGPWPVDRPTDDKSFCGIHQLLSNGVEWVDQEERGKRLSLNSTETRFARTVGESPTEPNVIILSGIEKKYGEEDWTKVDGLFAGFRIVIEPPQ